MIWLSLFALLVIAYSWPNHWLVREGMKYLRRWPLVGGDGLCRAPWKLGREGSNLFLHWICMSDGPNVHSHPFDAKALLLWGRYADIRVYRTTTGAWTLPQRDEYGPGDINSIDGDCFHTLELLTPFVVTLCWTSKKHGRGWNFLVNGKVVNASGRGAAAYDEANGDA